MKLPKQKTISFTPFREELFSYQKRYWKGDIWGAIAVALMTIPQSIAYSLLAGLPPMAGLYAAIFGTFLTAIWGSSKTLVSGPSTGTAILLQTSMAEVLPSMSETMSGDLAALSLLTQIVCLVGLIQLGAAFFNVNKLLQFVSRPVELGYFGGITVAIMVTQAFSFGGIHPPQGDDPILFKGSYFFSHLHQINLSALLTGLVSLGSLLVLRKYWKNGPNALIMLGIGSLFAWSLHFWIESPGLTLLGSLKLPSELSFDFFLPWFDLKTINKLLPSALAIAFLGILEVSTISRTFGVKMGQRVNINQDVFGLGVANTFLSFIKGAMPSSGSSTRTLINYHFEAKTRFAAVLSGVLTAGILFFCWPLIEYIPMAALAALLIASVHALIDWKEIGLIFRATKEDALVFFLTFVSCLLFRLDIAFFLGIMISIGTYLKKSAVPHLVEYAFNPKGRLMTVSPKQDVHRKVRIIGIGGDLYFASAEVFQSALLSIAEDPYVQAIVLRINNVHHMDASMCLAILRLYETLAATNRHLLISGLTDEVWQVLHRAGIVKKIGLDQLYFADESNPQFSTWKAALRAQEIIH